MFTTSEVPLIFKAFASVLFTEPPTASRQGLLEEILSKMTVLQNRELGT